MKYSLSFFLVIFFLSGCCSRTTLVLLPDDSGSVGEATMKTREGEISLDTPYSYTEIRGPAKRPKKIRQMSPEDFSSRWGKLEEMEPDRPLSFTLYFLSGSTELTEESQSKLPDVVQAIKRDIPVEVNVIGHSDKVGKEEYNNRLSLERAKVVHNLLQEKAPWLKRVFVQSHGENDPLVPTADNVAEPKNRRVEIFIR